METQAVEWTEWLVHRIFFWETDDKKKGRILRAFHHFLSYALLTLIVIAHTIYPAFWLQTVLLGISSLVWMHHVATHGCVVSKVEQKLLGDSTSFLDPFLELFDIEASERSKQGILILGSTLGVSILALEWFSRVHHKVFSIAKQIQLPVLTSSSIPSIHLPTSYPSI